MASSKVYGITRIPQLFDLFVSMSYAGSPGQDSKILFAVDPAPNQYGDTIPVEIRALECRDKIFGVYEFGGIAFGQYVTGEFCYHNSSGTMSFHGLVGVGRHRWIASFPASEPLAA